MRPHAPTDILACSEAWGANCGPAALAAALGVQVADVRDAVSSDGDFKDRSFMGIMDMKTAIHRYGATLGNECYDAAAVKMFDDPWPGMNNRVVMIQWRGSWESVPRAAAAHRHWIAQIVLEDETIVFDANEEQWITFEDWRDRIVPQLLPPRATGWRPAYVGQVIP